MCCIRRETGNFNNWLCSRAARLIADLEMFPFPHCSSIRVRKAKKLWDRREKEKTASFARPTWTRCCALPFTSSVLWYWYVKEENKSGGGSSSPVNVGKQQMKLDKSPLGISLFWGNRRLFNMTFLIRDLYCLCGLCNCSSFGSVLIVWFVSLWAGKERQNEDPRTLLGPKDHAGYQVNKNWTVWKIKSNQKTEQQVCS